MSRKLIDTGKWLPFYFLRQLQRVLASHKKGRKEVYFCICDHFEPYRGNADRRTARKRIQRWLDEYPKVASRHLDAEGCCLKYSFFYPEEEYYEEDLSALAGLCHAGFGEVEIHLHHDDDTSDNLRRLLLDYKNRLHEKHGLLSIDEHTGIVSYGFIHGNWALDNSHPEGRWCGVNDEISILQETGCYADLTMPSAPNGSQTRKVNSIYYAVDDPGRPKSHNWGVDAQVGLVNEGLLMIQGPLRLNWKKKKYGFFPGIENGGLYGNAAPTLERVSSWLETGVCVKGAEDHIFIKIYTHGAQEDVSQMLFDQGGFDSMFDSLMRICGDRGDRLHFVSAREMTNVILAIENLMSNGNAEIKNYRYRTLSE